MYKIVKLNIQQLKFHITQIHRLRKGNLITNYYGNLDKKDFVYAIHDTEAIVFWADDNGTIRVYFCAVSEDELVQLLKLAPEEGVFDYITRNEGNYQQLFQKAGWLKFSTLKRFNANKRTAEDLSKLQQFHQLVEDCTCCGNIARKALPGDCDAIMSLLLGNLDPREMHICSREELLQFIQDESVSVYYEGNELKGLYLDVFKAHSIYSYIDYNNSHPGALSSLWLSTYRLAQNYMNKIFPAKIRNTYCWINVKNRPALRFIKHLKYEFDGLYDDMYNRKGEIAGRDSWRKYSD